MLHFLARVPPLRARAVTRSTVRRPRDSPFFFVRVRVRKGIAAGKGTPFPAAAPRVYPTIMFAIFRKHFKTSVACVLLHQNRPPPSLSKQWQ